MPFDPSQFGATEVKPFNPADFGATLAQPAPLTIAERAAARSNFAKNFKPAGPEATANDYLPNNILGNRAKQLNNSLDRQDQGQQTGAETALQLAGNSGAGTFNDYTNKAFGAASNLYHKLPQTIQDAAKQTVETMNPLAKPYNDLVKPAVEKATQYASDKFNSLSPRLKENITAVGNPIQAVGTAKAIDQTKDALKFSKQDINNSLEKKYTTQNKEEWAKPANTPKPTFNKASEIYNKAQAKGHDIADTLTNNKLKISDHIENGTYATAETADKIRSDAAKMSNDFLRPSLEKADFSVPKTPVKDVVDSAVDNINNDRTITQERKNILTRNLSNSQAALEQKYSDGMSLTNLHDEKIVRDINSKYSPVGDIATNNEAIKNKAIGDAARKIVETQGEKAGIPVKEFNAELSKQYQAANYLDALDKKKAPLSLGASIRKTTAKVVGAAVGHNMGGGILGGVGGYHIGGMVEGFLENLPNPLKNYYLNNLQVTNPEAFNAVKNYAQYAPGQLALPAPKSTYPKASINVPMEGRAGTVDVINPSLQETRNMVRSRTVTPKYRAGGGRITQIFGEPK